MMSGPDGWRDVIDVNLTGVHHTVEVTKPTMVEQGNGGFRTEHRTFFVWEGVTQYLTEDAVRATLGRLASAASGSRLVFTYIRRDFIEGTNLYGSKSAYRKFRVKQQLWHFGLHPDEVAAFIAEYGWRLVEQAGPDYFVRHYIEPAGRDSTASRLEWTAYAETK